MLSSSTSDSFTPNKKKKKRPDSITKWTVILHNGQLMIAGSDKTGQKPVVKICQYRISNYIFCDINGTVYSLLGHCVNNDELPKYIQNKFKIGIPAEWNNIIQIWKTYEQLGCPTNYNWEESKKFTDYNTDYTDIESTNRNESIQELQKKIDKYTKRLRANILRESLLASNVSHSHKTQKTKDFYHSNITEENINNKQIKILKNNIFNTTGNEDMKVVSFHKQRGEETSQMFNNVQVAEANDAIKLLFFEKSSRSPSTDDDSKVNLKKLQNLSTSSPKIKLTENIITNNESKLNITSSTLHSFNENLQENNSLLRKRTKRHLNSPIKLNHISPTKKNIEIENNTLRQKITSQCFPFVETNAMLTTKQITHNDENVFENDANKIKSPLKKSKSNTKKLSIEIETTPKKSNSNGVKPNQSPFKTRIKSTLIRKSVNVTDIVNTRSIKKRQSKYTEVNNKGFNNKSTNSPRRSSRFLAKVNYIDTSSSPSKDSDSSDIFPADSNTHNIFNSSHSSEVDKHSFIKEYKINVEPVNKSLENENSLKQTKKNSKLKKSTNVNTVKTDIAQNEPTKNNTNLIQDKSLTSSIVESSDISNMSLPRTNSFHLPVLTNISNEKFCNEIKGQNIYRIESENEEIDNDDIFPETSAINNINHSFELKKNVSVKEYVKNVEHVKTLENNCLKQNKKGSKCINSPNIKSHANISINTSKNSEEKQNRSRIQFGNEEIDKEIKKRSKPKKSTNVNTDLIPENESIKSYNIIKKESKRSKKQENKIDLKIIECANSEKESVEVENNSTQNITHKTKESQSNTSQTLLAPAVTETITNTDDVFLKPPNVISVKDKNKLKASDTKRKKSDTMYKSILEIDSILENSNMTDISRNSVISSSSILSNTSISSRGRRRVPSLPYWQGHRLKIDEDDISIQKNSETCNLDSYLSQHSNLSLTESKLNNSSAKGIHSHLPSISSSPFKKVISNKKHCSGSNKKYLHQSVEEINKLKISDKIVTCNQSTDTKSIQKFIKPSKMKLSKQKPDDVKIQDKCISLNQCNEESYNTLTSKQDITLNNNNNELKKKGKTSTKKFTNSKKIIIEKDETKSPLRKRKNDGSKINSEKLTKQKSTNNNEPEINKVNSSIYSTNESSKEMSQEIISPLKKRTKSLPNHINSPIRKTNHSQTQVVNTKSPIRKKIKHINTYELSESAKTLETNQNTEVENNILRPRTRNASKKVNNLEKSTSTTQVFNINSADMLPESDVENVENNIIPSKKKSISKKVNSEIQNQLNPFIEKSTKSAKKQITKKIEANDVNTVETLKKSNSNDKQTCIEVEQSSKKSFSVEVKSNRESVYVEEINSGRGKFKQNVSTNLFKDETPNSLRRSSRFHRAVNYKDNSKLEPEEFKMPRSKTKKTLSLETNLKDNSIKGPKQTVIFKVPKSKKNRLILPIDPIKLYENVAIKTTVPFIKEDSQKPVQRILSNNRKKRKLFQGNNWLESTEFNNICENVSETEDKKPSFILKFNSEIPSKEFDDTFSDVSGMFK